MLQLNQCLENWIRYRSTGARSSKYHLTTSYTRRNISVAEHIECIEIEVRSQVGSEVERFWLRKSATIHAAPVIAKFCALPAQLIIL
jgi:hypothetical protein